MIIINLIKYHLYLLQLENYELGRFWKLLFAKGWLPPKQQRKDLVWTAKAKSLVVMAAALHLLITVALFGNGHYFLGIVIFILLFGLYAVLFSLALIILWPVDWLIKKIIVAQAASRIQSLPKLTVIAIAGSYGKTTMKEVVSAVLSAKWKVASTPESVNTPVGIARWILKNVNDFTEVLVVEMGEHYNGDILELCRLAQPDVAVVTGINEAHLERMGSLENVTRTIFEVVAGAKPAADVFVNGDDEIVSLNFPEFLGPKQHVEKFKASNVQRAQFNLEKLCWEGEIDQVGKVEINLLGEYSLAFVDAAVKIAKSLGEGAEEIKKGIANIKPVEHRLQPIKGAGEVLVIDDAYNGNSAGAAEAIKVLSRFVNRRKLFITPGLVETGSKVADVHRAIGKQLAGVADVVILIKNSVTQYIEEGIKNAKLQMQNEKLDSTGPEVIWFDSSQEAHASLGKILKPNDVVVFQNDWGDQYI